MSVQQQTHHLVNGTVDFPFLFHRIYLFCGKIKNATNITENSVDRVNKHIRFFT